MFAFTSYREHLDKLREQARSRLLDELASLPVHPETEPLVIVGEPADVLVDRSAQLGLIVVGSRAYGPLRRVLLGSISDALLDRTACPVMVIPRGVQHAFGSLAPHARAAGSR